MHTCGPCTQALEAWETARAALMRAYLEEAEARLTAAAAAGAAHVAVSGAAGSAAASEELAMAAAAHEATADEVMGGCWEWSWWGCWIVLHEII